MLFTENCSPIRHFALFQSGLKLYCKLKLNLFIIISQSPHPKQVLNTQYLFLVVPQICCVSDLKIKVRLINGKMLELIEISTLLMIEFFH